MPIPLVCFLSYNRAGAAASNLKALLQTEDDFELCIVDNGSVDGIWEYIETLKDDRIKIKHRFERNYGVVYAINYGLSKRTKNQPFIHIENDVWVKEPHFIQKFEQTLSAFPDLGLIGAVSKAHFDTKLSTLVPVKSHGKTCYYANMLIGCFNYLTPEVIELIGYWNEETCGADKEIGPRINLFTPFRTAYTGEFYVDFRTQIHCDACPMLNLCRFERTVPCECCREFYPKLYTHKSFASVANLKTQHYLEAIKSGKRSFYSASVHDINAQAHHYYDKASAEENFSFFSAQSSHTIDML